MADFDPVAVLRVLTSHRVDFVVVGGIAARLRGAPLLTQDLDVTPATDRQNLARLTAGLEELDARLRTATAPHGVAFPFDPAFLESAAEWTLTTRFGDLDLVISPAGTGGFRELITDADEVTVAVKPDLVVNVASLRDVIRSKEAAGREKDRAALPLLRRTLEESHH
ncbi:MAG TPA: hypothetical protein VFV13_05850 [Acidimicrobiia bacterium]|nr:hypothetical protein [Acidimicrobiia bacterium]